ncbi:MAG: PD-(D/E)XK nuclease family protein [Clostridia bacterium]|nr:PD-(D/E)XK nuclease family protein [Clostridia bacterium]
MARITVCQSGAWHEFHEHKNSWMGTEPSIVIIPEHEDKGNVAQAFAYVNIGAIVTIPELIARYIQSRGGEGLISPHVTESILGSIMADSPAAYLKMEKFKQSYLRTLADLICNFRKTSLLNLEEAIAGLKAGRLSSKEKDLIKIYSEYEKRLPNYGFDLRSGLAEFLRHTGEDNIHRHLGIRENEGVIFLGFDYLSPLEEAFVFTVFKYISRASLLFCTEAAASEQAMRIRKSIAALLERSKHLAVEHKILPLQRQDFFVALSRDLFKPDSSVSMKKTGAPGPEANPGVETAESRGKVTVSRENSRFQEIVSIARQIRMLAEAGVALSDIRVVAPAYHLYGSIIEEVFPEYALAFSLEQGDPLLRFPLAAVILHLVNQGVSPNPYPLREKILSSPYISFSDQVRPSDLVKYQEAGGVELLSRERLNALIKPGSRRLDFHYVRNIRQEAYRTVKPVPGIPLLEVVKRYMDGAGRKSNEEMEDQLCQCLVQFYLLGRAEKTLSAWQARMSGAEFKEALQGMLENFHVAENIGFAGDTSPELKVRERERAVLGRIDQLLAEMVSSLNAAGQSPATKFNLAELARIFSRLMGEASLDRKEYAAVVIQPVNRGQYEKWGYTFLCGMVDGEFPAAEAFNFLQPKKEGLGLGQAYTSVDHGRSRLFDLVRSTACALFLSHPLSDNGRRLPPSPFIREIEKRVPAELPGTEGPETDAGGDKLYSRREKLLLIGKNVDNHYDKVRPLLKELKNEDEAFFRNIAEILRFDGLTLNAAWFSEFDGLFGREPSPSSSAAFSLALLAEEVRNITFTPAVLERYAACPLRFFFDDIMRLKEGPDFDPDTTEAGVLVRSILKEYTAMACAAKGVPDDAPLLFLELVERHLKEQEQEGVDAFHLRFINGLTAGLDKQTERRRGLFCAFLEHEKNGPDFLSPYLAGMAGAVKLSDELVVRVETDRVDLAGTTGSLLPFLYTSAGTGDPGKIRRGLRFDLPLAVLFCMDDVVQKHMNLSVAGAGLYQVKTAKTVRRGGYFAVSDIRSARQTSASPDRPVFSGQREGFLGREDFAQALEKCKSHILRLYRLMQKGVFHLPLCPAAEQTCHNCSFGRLCRKDQLRLEKLRNRVAGDAFNGEKLNLVKDIF